MNRRMRLLMLLLAAMAVLIPLGGVAQAAPAAPTPDTSDAAFRASAEPKTVELDATTGEVLSVTAGAPMRPNIATGGGCDGVASCTYPQAPYQRWQWFGTPGSANVNWPGQQGWDTNAYTSAVCWIPPGGGNVCSQWWGPWTYVGLNAVVTITQARL